MYLHIGVVKKEWVQDVEGAEWVGMVLREGLPAHTQVRPLLIWT